MHAVSILFIFCFAFCIYGLPSPRIVGGSNALIEKYPYIVSLRQNGIHFCGGTIINKRYILTAAHCKDNQIYVSVGTKFSLDETGTVYEIESFAAHKEFNETYGSNDIGLIRLKKDIQFSSKVQPVVLATQDNFAVGHSAITVGWGDTSPWGKTPNDLQELNTQIMSREKCAYIYWAIDKAHKLNESNICAFTKFGEGVCNGDSGGPLIVNNVQVGIISMTVGCAIGIPDLYISVPYYKDWIEQNMKDF